MSHSLGPHGLYSSWNSPGQNPAVGSIPLLQGIFPTQESNRGFLHCRRILYQLSYQGSLMLLNTHLPCISNSHYHTGFGASLVAQLVKNPPAMQETLVRFLSQEEPLEKGMAIHSSILAWRIPPTEEEPGGVHEVSKSQTMRPEGYS